MDPDSERAIEELTQHHYRLFAVTIELGARMSAYQQAILELFQSRGATPGEIEALGKRIDVLHRSQVHSILMTMEDEQLAAHLKDWLDRTAKE